MAKGASAVMFETAIRRIAPGGIASGKWIRPKSLRGSKRAIGWINSNGLTSLRWLPSLNGGDIILLGGLELFVRDWEVVDPEKVNRGE